MTSLMSITQLKRGFYGVLERVHFGEEIIVTRRGVPWGRMLPPESDESTDNAAGPTSLVLDEQKA